ncbi:MAG: CDP-2,3-bis-(O-geranylgeranyl)-sn-glycerol synthase [archaeon]|nr:CDP-2,3-bis-(O-geranylgeranyl)-sn-glycerol synthase [archaeon]
MVNFINIIFIIISAILFILPAYVANGSALVFGGGTPLDMGKSLKDGRRLIGDGVTWKGFIGGTIVGTIIGAILGLIGQLSGITINQLSFGMINTVVYGDILSGLLLGFLLAFGALCGDAIGSFIKRRIGIQRGKSAPIMDQLDFVIVAIILSLLLVKLDILFILLICVLTLIIHLGTNAGAYLLGLKDVWY